MLAPTQSGKTTLAFQLLQKTTKPDLPGLVLVMKPRDPTVTKWTKALKYKIVRDWPPKIARYPKPPGYTIWPKHTFDIDTDDAKLKAVFNRTIMDSYKRGNRILFGDEVYGLDKELGLGKQLQTVWSRGAAMGCGLWSASQRPFSVPQMAYSQATHVFLAHDPDKRDRDRYGEIGGVDPKALSNAVLGLKKYQFVYVNRNGPYTAIIDP